LKGRFYVRFLDSGIREVTGSVGLTGNSCEFFKDKDVVKFIKLSRLRWAGHVMRLSDNDPAKNIPAWRK
jgi:hypothetical protein